jgi:hypothetical protein
LRQNLIEFGKELITIFEDHRRTTVEIAIENAVGAIKGTSLRKIDDPITAAHVPGGSWAGFDETTSL